MDTGCRWKSLPKDIWEMKIIPKLSHLDITRFAAVCRSWRSIAAEIRPSNLPWFMISRNKISQLATFLSLQEGKLYHLKLSKLACDSLCLGSSQSYLIMSNNQHGNFLYNPFSRTRISLPPNLHCFFQQRFQDIIFYKGKLHGLTRNKELVRFEGVQNQDSMQLNTTTLPIEVPPQTDKYSRFYLVESRGELLMCGRYQEDGYKFLIAKLDQTKEPFRWLPLESLGCDEMLFMGGCSSISASATAGFEGNCVIFGGDVDGNDYGDGNGNGNGNGNGWPYDLSYEDLSYGCGVHLDTGCRRPFIPPHDSISFIFDHVWLMPPGCGSKHQRGDQEQAYHGEIHYDDEVGSIVKMEMGRFKDFLAQLG